MRKTKALVNVARVLVSDPDARHYGYALMRDSGVKSGVMYPLLTRLLDGGLLVAAWEDIEDLTENRPRRRYYQLTELGRTRLAAIATAADNPLTVDIRRIQEAD